MLLQEICIIYEYNAANFASESCVLVHTQYLFKINYNEILLYTNPFDPLWKVHGVAPHPEPSFKMVSDRIERKLIVKYNRIASF